MGVVQPLRFREGWRLFNGTTRGFCESALQKNPLRRERVSKVKGKPGGRAYFSAAGVVVTCLVSVLMVPSGLLVVSFLVLSLPPPNTEKCT
jgi:hypothetical protein